MLDNKGFDLWADEYDKAVGVSDEENAYPFAGYKKVLSLIFSRIMQKPKSAVLDIGFGTGILTAKLYEHGFHIYGQDFSPRMIAIASSKMPGAHLYEGDITNGLCAPLLENRYDFIIATYSLHHLTDEQKVPFIKSLLELLNEGGSVIIGDVAFAARKEQELCKADAGEGWDDDEYYFIIDEMKQSYPALEFIRTSFCSGIIVLSK